VRVLFLGVAALLALLAYHVYFIRTGNVYSLSTVPGLDPFLMSTLTGTLIGLGIGLLVVAARLWWEKERAWVDIALSAYGFVFFVLYFLGVQIAIGYFYNGLVVTWHLPDFSTAFLQFVAMIQWLIVAAVGIVLPAVALLLNGVAPRAIWKAEPYLRGWAHKVRRNWRGGAEG
jgi:hypothetical protein